MIAPTIGELAPHFLEVYTDKARETEKRDKDLVVVQTEAKDNKDRKEGQKENYNNTFNL